MKQSTRTSFPILVIATCLLLAGCSSSSDEKATTTSANTKTSQTSTSTSTTTTSVAPDTGEQPDLAIWPEASTSTRFKDPVDAAKSFASDYLGFVDPLFGEFQQGDSRSGEVPVRTSAQGPVTTVMVRQLDDDSWWVVGAASNNLQIEAPTSGQLVASPVKVSGQSTAFEGTINIEVREDGRKDPLASGIAQGGSMGEFGPFSTSLNLSEGGSSAGAVIVSTLSAKDGNIAEASVVRIHF